MKEMSFLMAQDLGLIPKINTRFVTTQFLFETNNAYQIRCDESEIGYRIDLHNLKEKYKIIY